jgi:hypothetical protein
MFYSTRGPIRPCKSICISICINFLWSSLIKSQSWFLHPAILFTCQACTIHYVEKINKYSVSKLLFMSINELIRISNYCCLPGCCKIVLDVDDHVTRFYASCISKIINILGNFWINVPLYAHTVVSNSDPHVGGMRSQEILLMREGVQGNWTVSIMNALRLWLWWYAVAEFLPESFCRPMRKGCSE